MKIAIVSDWETQHGGAAVSASNLAYSLSQKNVNVTRIVSLADRCEHPWKTIEVFPTLLLSKINSSFPLAISENVLNFVFKTSIKGIYKNLSPQIINLHNIHGAISSGWLFKLLKYSAEAAPVVWTLHDMWSFTGRCAFNYGCDKYLVLCDDSCPTPYEYPPLNPLLISKSWNIRHDVINQLPGMVVVTPSRWLADRAKNGLWSNHLIKVIPYGIPIEIYKPIDKNKARDLLGINHKDLAILIVVHNMKDRRKGIDLIIRALKMIEIRPVTLIMVGSNPIVEKIDGVSSYNLGYLTNEYQKVTAYTAADIFVHPALADNLPNTLLESLACGTPVIGFNVGGVPEVVRPSQTGWLAGELSSQALASTMEVALNEINHGLDLRSSCRSIAENEYSDHLQGERYIDLFKTLL